jgi:DNA-binding NtrC family response regulator
LTLSNKSILAVDDEFDIVTLIKHSLQKHDLNVFAFTDPFLALEHFNLNSKDYILVLSDIRMPGMSGFEFVRKVRAVHPTIKILLMSAFEINDSEFSMVLQSTAVDGFIQKPLSVRELNTIIRKHINVRIKNNNAIA